MFRNLLENLKALSSSETSERLAVTLNMLIQ
jgi:hypothetical protein